MTKSPNADKKDGPDGGMQLEPAKPKKRSHRSPRHHKKRSGHKKSSKKKHKKQKRVINVQVLKSPNAPADPQVPSPQPVVGPVPANEPEKKKKHKKSKSSSSSSSSSSSTDSKQKKKDKKKKKKKEDEPKEAPADSKRGDSQKGKDGQPFFTGVVYVPTPDANKNNVVMPGQQPIMMPGQQPVMMTGQQPMMMAGQQPVMMAGQQPVMMAGQQPMMVAAQQQQPMMVGQQQPMMVGQQQPMLVAAQQQPQQPVMVVGQQQQPAVQQVAPQPYQPAVAQAGQPAAPQPYQPAVAQAGQPVAHHGPAKAPIGVAPHAQPKPGIVAHAATPKPPVAAPGQKPPASTDPKPQQGGAGPNASKKEGQEDCKPDCDCQECANKKPKKSDRAMINEWTNFQIGAPFPSSKCVQAMGRPLDTLAGESKEQFVAMAYIQGEPVMGRVWKDPQGKIAASFSRGGREFKNNVGTIEILLENSDNVRGFDYGWRDFNEAAEIGSNKEWQPIHVNNICPCVMTIDGKEVLGKVDLRNERALAGYNGAEKILLGSAVGTTKVLCRKAKPGFKLAD